MGVNARMLVRIKGTITSDDARRWSYLACSAFGADRFRIDHEAKEHVFSIIDEFWQDGPSIFPEPGEMFLSVALAGRYYGYHYERGNLPFYIMIASWIELTVPNATVWYGGDSSGVLARPFDTTYRTELWKYFCRVDHRPYRDDAGWINSPTGKPTCPLCQVPMPQFGTGPKYAMFSCPCGWTHVVKDGVVTAGPNIESM
jgi:hypothetical protein